MNRTLDRLLAELSTCLPSERIGLRGPILAYGTDAIDPLLDLAARAAELGPTTAAWLEELAKRDVASRPRAVAGLRQLAAGIKLAAPYAAAALERLGATPTPERVPSRPSVPRAAGTEWTGFQAHEFGRNVGTSWRSAAGRASLAPILVRGLRELDPDFISFGVERSPEIHFAVARRYKGSEISGFTASKLVVYAHGPTDEAPDAPAQVGAGYYIERGDGSEPFGNPANAVDWDWPLFMAALGRDAFRAHLGSVMTEHDLSLGDYGAGRLRASLGWVAGMEDGEIVARGANGQTVARGWPEIIERLAAVPATAWLDLHLWRTWPAEEAIAAGQPFAIRTLGPVLLDVARLYLQVVGPTRSAR